jgi:hypothetical protein
MKVHELHTLLNDISHHLQRNNPGLEFRSEATNDEAALSVMYPDGRKSRFHVNITEDDEIIPQPVFHTATEDVSDTREIKEQALNDQWVAMLKERIQKTGFESFYDEIGGEG